MTTTIQTFAALTLALAALLVLYVASLRFVARSASHFPWMAVIPILTPVHTWRVGGRGLAIAMTSAAVIYGLLWIAVS